MTPRSESINTMFTIISIIVVFACSFQSAQAQNSYAVPGALASSIDFSKYLQHQWCDLMRYHYMFGHVWTRYWIIGINFRCWIVWHIWSVMTVEDCTDMWVCYWIPMATLAVTMIFHHFLKAFHSPDLRYSKQVCELAITFTCTQAPIHVCGRLCIYIYTIVWNQIVWCWSRSNDCPSPTTSPHITLSSVLWPSTACSHKCVFQDWSKFYLIWSKCSKCSLSQ